VMINWITGLLLVLVIFMACVLAVRKLRGGPLTGPEKLRVVGALALGMREKIILLQVGKKQVLLGVSPGRIQTLHVLEGDDCLADDTRAALLDGSFSQKLMQAMKARSDA